LKARAHIPVNPGLQGEERACEWLGWEPAACGRAFEPVVGVFCGIEFTDEASAVALAQRRLHLIKRIRQLSKKGEDSRHFSRLHLARIEASL
jgi:hypothetical protein